MKQTEVFLWYLKRIRFTFSKMVTEMDEIVCDAVIECEKGSITNEQLNIIHGIADYLERETTEGEKNKMTGEVFTDLKCRLRAYCCGLASVDDIFGYMQCLVDLRYLKMVDIKFILECICSKDRTDREWIFK